MRFLMIAGGCAAALATAAALALVACERTDHVAARPRCSRAWRAEWSADSGVAVCLPPGFRAVYHDTRPTEFERGTPTDTTQAQFIITTDAALTSGPLWPPRLLAARSCRTTDCYMSDSTFWHDDTLSEVILHVETGLMTGGREGYQRRPALIGSGQARQRRVLVFGTAKKGATLDTIRRILRTARLSW